MSLCSQHLAAQVSWTTHLSRLKRNKAAEEKMEIECVHMYSCTAVDKSGGRRLVRTKLGWCEYVKPKKKLS